MIYTVITRQYDLYVVCMLTEELVNMGLMSEAHKHNLNRNRVQLMKNVQCLPSIFEFLRQDYTLTGEMQAEIQVTHCSLT